MSGHWSGVILKTDGTTQAFYTALETPSLRELQRAVGGYIERIRMMQHVSWFKEDPVMIANEEGRIKNLPPNMEASLLVQLPICGDVVIMPRKLFK